VYIGKLWTEMALQDRVADSDSRNPDPDLGSLLNLDPDPAFYIYKNYS
jgi:hypothetical protein